MLQQSLESAANRQLRRLGYGCQRLRDPLRAGCALLRGVEVRTVLDVGAAAFPSATVYAFEIFPLRRAANEQLRYGNALLVSGDAEAGAHDAPGATF